MDFTREPIIETVVTPRDGFRLVVRSSKSVGQEEYFVDAVEVVSFGNHCFYRSLEKPKAFLVPAVDYEVLEVREARIVLKNVGLDRSIKIGGGREQSKPSREIDTTTIEEEHPVEASQELPAEESAPQKSEGRTERKRDRRRHYRRRRGREDGATTDEADLLEKAELGDGEERIALTPPSASAAPPSDELQESITAATSILSSLLTPPPLLISETLSKYKENILFKGAFYEKAQMEELVEGEPTGLEESEEQTSQANVHSAEHFLDMPFDENMQRPEPPAKD